MFWVRSQRCKVRSQRSLVHPVDSFKPVAMVIKRAVGYEVQNPVRKVLLTKLEIRSNELRQKEDELHQGVAPHLRKVAGTKNLLLWKELLEQSNFDSRGIYSFLSVGVRIVGREPHLRAYRTKLIPASFSKEELSKSALQRRKALELSCTKGVSPEQRSQLMPITLEKRDAGYLGGPYSSAEVKALFGHSRWNEIRRFVLVQDMGQQAPIDRQCLGKTVECCLLHEHPTRIPGCRLCDSPGDICGQAFSRDSRCTCQGSLERKVPGPLQGLQASGGA